MKNPADPEARIVTLEMTEPQMLAQVVQANYTLLLWGRGTGKSTRGGAPYVRRVADAMPGHLGCWLGLNYTHLETNVMPKLLLGLHELGWKEGKDYVFGRPPKSWPSCLYPIKNWDRTLTYRNGSSFQQISISEKGSANAFDFQSLLCDEGKFFRQKQVEGEVLPTLRGFDELFGHLPEYLSQFWMTDKYADYITIKWLLDKRKRVDQKKINTVIQLQITRDQLQVAAETATRAEQRKIAGAIKQIDTRLMLLRKDLVYVSEASAESNRKNLGEKWWQEQRNKGKYEFSVATRNLDPTRSTNGFYPGLDEQHKYFEPFQGYGYDRSQPFIIAMDYQASIAPMDVCQLCPLPGATATTLNFIKEFYSKHPEGLEETVEKFCNYYASHPSRLVYYVYDNTAIGRRASAKKVKDIVVDALVAKGWAVNEVYTGQPLEHNDRYQKIKKRMEEKEETKDYYPFRFNRQQCPKTIISLQGAGTKTVAGITKKDKEYENVVKYPDIDQSETTHFSEVVDQVDFAVNELKLIAPMSGGTEGMGTGFR